MLAGLAANFDVKNGERMTILNAAIFTDRRSQISHY
jgi:hypothetical protein